MSLDHFNNDESNKKVNMEVCAVPRWIQLKETLNNFNYQEFIQNYNNDDAGILIDVRTIQEFQSGSIFNSKNINYLSSDLADQLDQLSKQNNYYVFCRTGRRSIRVCVLMRNMGYRVFNLDGGIAAK